MFCSVGPWDILSSLTGFKKIIFRNRFLRVLRAILMWDYEELGVS